MSNSEDDPSLSVVLAHSPLLRDVDPAGVHALGPYLDTRQLAAGELLIREGELGDNLYIIRRGRLRVVAADAQGSEILLSQLDVGHSVGEITAITGGRQTATVYADTDCELLCLSRENFSRLGQQHPEAAHRIARNIKNRRQQNHLHEALKVSKLLGDLDDQLLSELAAKLERKVIRSGEVLVREGDASDAMYIIISGRLRMIRERQGAAVIRLGELGRGETVGEIGIVTGEPRTATVYAIRDSVLARLSSEGFAQLLDRYPQAMTRQISAKVIRRLEGQIRGTVRAENKMATFAVVALQPNLALTDFAKSLAQAMAAIKPTRHITSRALSEELSLPGWEEADDDDPTGGLLLRGLAELELQFDYLLYETDGELNSWSRRCLRQADHILFIADGSATPDQERIAHVLAALPGAREKTRCSLVLLHAPEVETPSGTLRWLNATRVETHYHVRLGSEAHFGRLARLVTGNGIGVVLSGGGARGYAHLGALRALQEAGVPIDVIGGTSAGGVMAFQHAMGWDAPTLLRKNQRTVNYPFDYTFPITALMAGGGLTDGMQDLFGDMQIEDLWLPCFCVTTSLFEGEAKVHTRGPAWKYARASSSIPGIVPPVIDDQQVLVDGGLLNNLPAEVLRQRSDVRTVFALEVSVPKTPSREKAYAYESRLSGWKVLWNRLNPFAPKQRVPTIGQIMIYITVLGNQQTVRKARDMADFYMRVSVGDYGLLEFKAFEEIIENGYRSARKTLEEWQKRGTFTQLQALSAATASNWRE